MTGIRQSFVFALEKNFGKGKDSNDTNYPWIQPPPGSSFESTPNRQTNDIYGAGDKFRQNVAYGRFSGTWSWTYMFDYRYIEPLMLAFESVNEKRFGDSGFGADSGGHYIFKKKNGWRVPSFVVRTKKLNKIVGGTDTNDETVDCKGCIVQQIAFSRGASSAQYQVQLSGVYVDEEFDVDDLNYELDWKDYAPELTEYSCLFQGNSVSNDTYVANTESISIQIGNNADAVYNVCTPFSSIYYEGNSQFQFSTTMYSWNPEIWRLRANSGGVDNERMKPAAKNLKPMDDITVASYNTSIHDNTAYNNSMETAYGDATRKLAFHIEGAVIKGVKRPSGDGNRIIDSVSSSSCSAVSLEITSSNTNMFSYNTISSTGGPDSTLPYKSEKLAGNDAHTIYFPEDYEPAVIAYIKLKEDTAVTDDDVDKLKQQTRGYDLLAGSTTLSSTTTGGSSTTLSAILLARGLKDVTGLTVEERPESGDDPQYITISGTPTTTETGYYFIADYITGNKGLLRIDVRPAE